MKPYINYTIILLIIVLQFGVHNICQAEEETRIDWNDWWNLSEAEIQVLASLQAAELDATPTDRATLEKGGERYWIFLEDWSEAFPSLIAKGLIAKDLTDGDESGYRLTEAGSPLGYAYNRERPDKYWYYYQRFYPAAYASATHSRLCERVFGMDLCQEGMVDMAALEDLLARLDLKPGDHLLDLGCGAGIIAEYISDQTGARLTGLDYAAPAIAVANERTANKRSRLTFATGDMNALDLPEQSFDAAISLDTLYWVADLADTLLQVVRTIKPGARSGSSCCKVVEKMTRPKFWRPTTPNFPKPSPS